MGSTLRVLTLLLACLLIEAPGRSQAKVVRLDWPDMSTRRVVGRFVGRLVDAAGKPLSGGKVAVLPALDARSWTRQGMDGSMPQILQLAWQDVDDSGGFSIAHADLVVREFNGGYDPCNYGASEFDPHLMASAPGRAMRAVPAVAWEGGDTDFGDVVLEPGVTVTGRLVDEAGRPLANELVWVDNEVRSSIVPPQVAAREVLDGMHGARTDASGTFRVPGLWPGDVRVVRHPGFEVLEEWIAAEPGRLLDIGEQKVAATPPEPQSSATSDSIQPKARPRGTGTIRGHARLASGEPAAGEWLAVMASVESDAPLLTVVRCDARGAFVVHDWPPGTWHLRLYPGGLADVELGEGETREVDIDVLGYGVVRGKVTDHGKPAAGWSVHTSWVQGGMTGPDGSYDMPLRGPGSEWICFGDEAWRTITVSRWGEDIALDVDLGDIDVSGRVVDARTGRPIEDAVVAIVRDEDRHESRTGIMGDFKIESVPAAASTLYVKAAGYEAFEQFLQLFDQGQYLRGRVVDDLSLQLTPVP